MSARRLSRFGFGFWGVTYIYNKIIDSSFKLVSSTTRSKLSTNVRRATRANVFS
ncbi:hypothetical protein SLEP1_g24634 [Rubroshorea leprosula]|uniref:Uncharacterized protein n=1 Tax=Rubroshorea leprosula TaxID=152421 RepID=A0AAV5JJF3_9ROSI|nr:hypothetical protein SLEP1_g24634 [Rubroshorea leprosula]